MSDESLIPPGRYLGQIATEFHIMYQWDGEKWERVPDYQGPPQQGGFIRFDVEDINPADVDPLDKVFRP